ncbi:ATP-dependent sacrificial sulfur transferase LarE [Desulfovibrio sp. JY]|nr:ATP-dependent sacrificial sulfur transferase LarE [Desulfovibrio sp. JY]
MADRNDYDQLLAVMRPYGTALVAFSGGVDSLLVLRAALDALSPEAVLAVTLRTPYTPPHDVAAASQAARDMGVGHEILDIPFPEALRDNPPDRCYTCKRLLFGHLVDRAAASGLGSVFDGTNADDLGDHRPGLRAVCELGIISPLLAAGLAKADIRRLSQELGLPGWDRPAGACLLTRIPHGVTVTEAELARIAGGEEFLRSIGFPEARLRSHGELARIEVAPDHVAALVAASAAHDVDGTFKHLGYRYVTVDLSGYRMGSLNAQPNQDPKTS